MDRTSRSALPAAPRSVAARGSSSRPRTTRRSSRALPSSASAKAARRHASVTRTTTSTALRRRRRWTSATSPSSTLSKASSDSGPMAAAPSRRSASARGSAAGPAVALDVSSSKACRKSARSVPPGPRALREPSSKTSRSRSRSRVLALSASSTSTTEYGRRRTAADREAPTSSAEAALAQSMRMSALRDPSHTSAKDVASDVLPTPGGPWRSSEAIGRPSSLSPALARATAVATRRTASDWPCTRAASAASSPETFIASAAETEPGRRPTVSSIAVATSPSVTSGRKLGATEPEASPVRPRASTAARSATSMALSGNRRCGKCRADQSAAAVTASLVNLTPWCFSYWGLRASRTLKVSSGVSSSSSTSSKRRSSAGSRAKCTRYSSKVVAAMHCKLPRASDGFNMSAALRGLDAVAPAPTRVCASSMNSTTPASSASASTLRKRSSKSPRRRVPAVRAPTSSAQIRRWRSQPGALPLAMRWAKASTSAVFPTPGSPRSRTFRFCRRPRARSTRARARSRPAKGSSRPCSANAVKSCAKRPRSPPCSVPAEAVLLRSLAPTASPCPLLTRRMVAVRNARRRGFEIEPPEPESNCVPVRPKPSSSKDSSRRFAAWLPFERRPRSMCSVPSVRGVPGLCCHRSMREARRR
mmetsp:Transcript_102470/g.298891  ORF Transcript_102470/g.298891 Transcript_102470/m.298891 type:complete len:648 (-) Transcript_102470:637-2580(-)